MIDRIREIEEQSGLNLDQLREQALDMAATARERFTSGGEALKHYTTEQPARALGIALGMGVLLGWLIKRR